jgi:hypothetical protein
MLGYYFTPNECRSIRLMLPADLSGRAIQLGGKLPEPGSQVRATEQLDGSAPGALAQAETQDDEHQTRRLSPRTRDQRGAGQLEIRDHAPTSAKHPMIHLAEVSRKSLIYLGFLAPAVGAAEAPKKSNKIKGRPSAKRPSDLHCAHRSDTVKCAILEMFSSIHVSQLPRTD